MLKTLFITRKWPPAVGGMETYSIELTEELRKLVNLNIFFLPGKPNGSPPKLFEIFIFFFKATIQCLKEKKNDVLHIGDMTLWPIAMISSVFRKKSILVISAHGTDVAYHLRAGCAPVLYHWYLLLGAILMKSRIKIIANSHATATYCKSHGFKNVYVVPLGVRMSHEVVGFATHPSKYILFVGRLARRKGAGWFTENVLPLLSEEIILKVAGTVWDEEEFKVIHDSKRTEFLGPIYGEELAKLRRNAIAVIMPNIKCGGRDFEGFGLTAVEAAADGAVLLASNIDGIVDAVVDGTTGWLLRSEDSVVWKNKIEEIMQWDVHKRSCFVTESRAAVAQFYSWVRVARDTAKIYKSADI